MTTLTRTPGAHLALRRPPLRVALPGAVVALYVFAATLGPLVRPYDTSHTNVTERLLPPGTALADGSTAWFGTDQVGRDLLAQVLAGARVSLVVAAATIVLGGALGLVLGLVSGYFGRWVDNLVMRLGDIQLAFPSILLAILIAGVLGPSVGNVILTLAITRWVIFARVVRASTLVAKRRESVDGAKVLGVPTVRILWRYVLPDVLGSLLVVATVQVGLMIIAEASLSFLGLGVPASQASWGSTISAGRDYLDSAWWIAAFPGLAMALLVVCVGVLGDALRHRTDPTVDL